MCLPDFDPEPGASGGRTGAGSVSESGTITADLGRASARNGLGKSAETRAQSATDVSRRASKSRKIRGMPADFAASQQEEASDFATAVSESGDHGRATEIGRALRKTTAPYVARKRSGGAQ